MPPPFVGAVVLGAKKGANLDLLQEFAIVDYVPLRDCVSFAAVCHFSQDVRTRGIEKSIECPCVAGLHGDKRFRYQTGDKLDDFLPLKVVPSDDKLCRLKRKSSDEHGEPAERCAFGRVEQIV